MSPPPFAGSDLPPVIQRAIARTMDPQLDLTHPERVALATLVARVQARDGASAFWVRRANFASLFERSERTVSNWLAALEAKGWIAKEQGRVRWGDFACLTVHLTQAAVAYFGLARSSDLSTAYRKKTAHAIGNQGLTQSFGDTGPAAAAPKESSAHPAFESKVPADCQLLLQLGMRPAAIFAAMGQARAAGQRLGDIVAVREAHLRAARSPLAYLRALIGSGIDYGALRGRTQLAAQRDEGARREAAAIEQAQRDYAGAVVEGRMAGTRVQVWGSAGATLLKWSAGKWVEAGSLAGEALLKFWLRLAADRPPPVGQATARRRDHVIGALAGHALVDQ